MFSNLELINNKSGRDINFVLGVWKLQHKKWPIGEVYEGWTPEKVYGLGKSFAFPYSVLQQKTGFRFKLNGGINIAIAKTLNHFTATQEIASGDNKRYVIPAFWCLKGHVLICTEPHVAKKQYPLPNCIKCYATKLLEPKLSQLVIEKIIKYW